MQEHPIGKEQKPQVPKMPPTKQPLDAPENRPPLFKRWRSWYVLVLGVLALLILLFYLFTNRYD